MDNNKNKVTLHIYDLSQGMAKVFSPMYLGKQINGIWHTGLVVFGKEYYFGGGICAGVPKQTPYGYPVEIYEMGETEVDQETFEKHLNDISPKYSMEKYDLFKNNCNNFTNECCELLLDKKIPEHITGLPDEILNTQIGQILKPVIEQMTNRVVNDQSNQHFGSEISYNPNDQSISSNPPNNNQSDQQLLVNNLANLISQNYEAQQQQPQYQQPQQAQQPQQPQQQQQQLVGQVELIEDVEMFSALTLSSPISVVDFYADWCGPCKVIKPFFYEMSNKYQNKIQFFQVNIDKSQDLAQTLEVSSIPTFMIYVNGNLKEKWTGGNKQELQSKLEKYCQ